MAPQIIYIVITFMGMLVAAHQHGKPKEGKNNFWIALLATGTVYALLYWGGFFDCFLNR